MLISKIKAVELLFVTKKKKEERPKEHKQNAIMNQSSCEGVVLVTNQNQEEVYITLTSEQMK